MTAKVLSSFISVPYYVICSSTLPYPYLPIFTPRCHFPTCIWVNVNVKLFQCHCLCFLLFLLFLVSGFSAVRSSGYCPVCPEARSTCDVPQSTVYCCFQPDRVALILAFPSTRRARQCLQTTNIAFINEKKCMYCFPTCCVQWMVCCHPNGAKTLAMKVLLTRGT